MFLDAKGGLGPAPLYLVSAKGDLLWEFNAFKTTVYSAGFVDFNGTGEHVVYACEQGRRDRMLGLDNVYWDKNRQLAGTPVSFDVVAVSPFGEEAGRVSFVDHGGPGAYEGIWGGAAASTVMRYDKEGRQCLAVMTFDGRILVVR